jgi:hypothetical protein
MNCYFHFYCCRYIHVHYIHVHYIHIHYIHSVIFSNSHLTIFPVHFLVRLFSLWYFAVSPSKSNCCICRWQYVCWSMRSVCWRLCRKEYDDKHWALDLYWIWFLGIIVTFNTYYLRRLEHFNKFKNKIITWDFNFSWLVAGIVVCFTSFCMTH